MNIKRSFFDRLSGAVSAGDAFDSFEDDLPSATLPVKHAARGRELKPALPDDFAVPAEGQLPVDVHQTPSEIVVRAFVAGVRPDELSVSIRRDMVEIGGSRMEREQISGPDYFSRELFWGSFSRSILLPEEVDVEASIATAKDGLLTIVMPKLDRARQTKLKVKAG
ncbi:MAG: Hsp20/alpha crystallin family protein [bacterium]|nr:Hsp20/alpha crystallin family protein [bacterium]